MHITNTKDLATVEISAALLAECADRDDLTLVPPKRGYMMHDVVFTVREN